MKQTEYQVQRRPMFTAGAQFENFLRPFSTMTSAIICLEGAKEKHYGYDWHILPVVSEGRSKNNVVDHHRTDDVRDLGAGGTPT